MGQYDYLLSCCTNILSNFAILGLLKYSIIILLSEALYMYSQYLNIEKDKGAICLVIQLLLKKKKLQYLQI